MAILENIDIDIGIDRDILSEGAYSRPLNSYIYTVLLYTLLDGFILAKKPFYSSYLHEGNKEERSKLPIRVSISQSCHFLAAAQCTF